MILYHTQRDIQIYHGDALEGLPCKPITAGRKPLESTTGQQVLAI